MLYSNQVLMPAFQISGSLLDFKQCCAEKIISSSEEIIKTTANSQYVKIMFHGQELKIFEA